MRGGGLGAALLLGGLALGCGGAPVAPPEGARADVGLPLPSQPLPSQPLPSVHPLAPRDPRIPAPAVQWRTYGIRVWRVHFALAEPPAILFGQIHQESRWRCDAVSPVGAQGCAQFMPATAVWIQTLLPDDVRALCSAREGCPTSPRWALAAAALYDWRLWTALAEIPTASDRWAMALVGYNGGPGWVRRERDDARRQGRDPERWWGSVEEVCLRAGWACRESRAYPTVILRQWVPLYTAWLGGP